MYEAMIFNKLGTLSSLSYTRSAKDEEHCGLFTLRAVSDLKLVCVKDVNNVLEDEICFI